jgi:hypothetical protein
MTPPLREIKPLHQTRGDSVGVQTLIRHEFGDPRTPRATLGLPRSRVAGQIGQGLAQVAADVPNARRRSVTLTSLGQESLAPKREVAASHLAGAWRGLADSERGLALPLLHHLAGIVDGHS